MTKMETSIPISELDGYFKMIEAQRDLAYHLQKYKEATEKKVEELKIITAKAQAVMNAKSHFKSRHIPYLNTLSEEDVKKVNALFNMRHIRI